MFVVRETGQSRVVGCIIVAEDQGSLRILIVVTIHVADNCRLDLLHELAEMQTGAIGEVKIAAD